MIDWETKGKCHAANPFGAQRPVPEERIYYVPSNEIFLTLDPCNPTPRRAESKVMYEIVGM